MHDEKGVSMKEAGPSQAVSVLGINGAPSAGDNFNVMLDEKEAKSIATKREQLYRGRVSELRSILPWMKSDDDWLLETSKS